MEPVLIEGAFRPAQDPAGEFSATHPGTRERLPERYPVSSQHDVDACLRAATACRDALSRARPEDIADFLEGFASGLEADVQGLVDIAHAETGLPREPRLAAVELPRTVHQLRLGAAAVRERSWVQATIDSQANLRSMLGPLGGAVIVFGPNNFPFAFNAVAGGDFVSALASRNPVLAKAHPLHPGTSKRLAEHALKALRQSRLPHAAVQMLYHVEPELGLAMVKRPEVAAIGFTGGRAAGQRLQREAESAGKLAYLELGSINPVFVLDGALGERGESIGRELAQSCLLGAGQFCTNPGLTVLTAGPLAEAFIERLRAAFEGAPNGTLLSESVETGLARAVADLELAGAERLTGGQVADPRRFSFQNTLLRVSGDVFLTHAERLQQEAFGPVHLTVVARDAAQMCELAERLEGNLTGSIYSDGAGLDDPLHDALAQILRRKVGRLLNDKMPTGVLVSPAMNHGGPSPATSHPGFTSVGIPASFRRFSALHCYDGVRQDRLPPELGDTNPTGSMWRLIDGTATQGNVR